ncbi:BCL-6 corepressor-like protein 1 [Dissostichus eleginoides]|uniref:BCL-6 corepressor-like protein 1 n=1 Tax=Dissostichus eleginoides TaxID=100907 RepID=A0AAD9F367_DISEL|nr:BCL-6 corepressor-like protein 1 [Dissostichus eleginoides]
MTITSNEEDICHNNMVLSCVIGHKRGRTNHSSHASKAEELRSPGTWGESRPRRKRQGDPIEPPKLIEEHKTEAL